MRTRHLIAGVLALVLAGCTAGAAATPAAEPSEPSAEAQATPEGVQPTAPTTPKPTEAPAATTAALDVKVTFDGETCTYFGPTTIVDGTVLRFEFAPDLGITAYLLVTGVKEGTTDQTLKEWQEAHPGNSVDNVPPWVIEPTASWTQGSGTFLYTIESVKAGNDGVDYPVGGYQVLCDNPVVYSAALLMVAGS
jgi:hypothetical protein